MRVGSISSTVRSSEGASLTWRRYAALWSPNSGRVDAHALVTALLRDGERAGAMLLRGTRLVDGEPLSGGYRLRLERETLTCETVVNAAGLDADSVSQMLGGETFRIYPCRGEYAELKPTSRDLVSGLVYPVPHPSGHGLGVHLTKTTDGAVLLGPTIRYQQSKRDYENDREPLDAFLEPTRRLLPQVTLADLRAGDSGIRAKLHPPEERFADFMIRPDAGRPALIHAAGSTPPALPHASRSGSGWLDSSPSPDSTNPNTAYRPDLAGWVKNSSTPPSGSSQTSGSP